MRRSYTCHSVPNFYARLYVDTKAQRSENAVSPNSAEHMQHVKTHQPWPTCVHDLSWHHNFPRPSWHHNNTQPS